MSRRPPRIVSLLPAATEMLFLVGAGDRVVGVSHECRFPAEALTLPRVTRSRIDSDADSAAIDAQVKTLLAEGEPLYELDAALLRRLAPDVIVTQAQCDVCALPVGEVDRALAADPALASVEVVAVNPQTVGEVLGDVARLGEAAGVAGSALRVRASLEERLQRLRPTIGGGRPRVVVVEWFAPPMVASNWTPELVRLAGGRYPLGSAGQPSEYATWEAIASASPDLLILAPCGFELDRCLAEWRRLPPPTGWETIPAVQRGRVFAVDGDRYFNRPGPRLVESAELVARMIRKPESWQDGAGATKLS